jgi:nicotinate-nucleotide--dimethylbenzimidazole phosphoribosyltransferase
VSAVSPSSIRARFDAVLLDIGGTLVHQAPAATAVADLQVELLPDVPADLAALSALVPLAAVTNTAVMREAEVRALLAHGGIEHYMKEVVTSVDVGLAKPHPAPILRAVELLGVSPERALMLGDDEVDRLAAEAAGCAYADGTSGIVHAVLSWLASQAGTQFDRIAIAVRQPDDEAGEEARARHLSLTKPAGSLGLLEDVGIHLAAMAGECPPPDPHPAALTVFAADHGVVAAGVTPWPSEVTTAMLANFASGGAAASVLARQNDVRLSVIDVGSIGGPPPGVLDRRVASGTANLAIGSAMTPSEARLALDVGVEAAGRALDSGARCLITGEMGIGNTTPSACLIAALTGRPTAEVTGRGTGIDDDMFAHKVEVVAAATRRAEGLAGVDLLAELGGLEIAALAGYIVAGAAAGVPVLIDGVIAVSGALVAEALAPGTRGWLIAGHRSVEPGASAGLAHLGLKPLLDLGLRLGEGTGALLAYPLIRSAVTLLGEMATFDSAGVPRKPA